MHGQSIISWRVTTHTTTYLNPSHTGWHLFSLSCNGLVGSVWADATATPTPTARGTDRNTFVWLKPPMSYTYCTPLASRLPSRQLVLPACLLLWLLSSVYFNSAWWIDDNEWWMSHNWWWHLRWSWSYCVCIMCYSWVPPGKEELYRYSFSHG